MVIGIPRALMYYRYGHLWKNFFALLGCETVESGGAGREILSEGLKYSPDESCLPAKAYLGHVRSLIGRCDYILVPRFNDFGKNDKLCERFFGLYDTVSNTFPGAPLLDYNLCLSARRGECPGFLGMGSRLGFSCARSLPAYREAKRLQQKADDENAAAQRRLLDSEGTKALVVSQPYVAHDPFIGEAVGEALRGLGVIPVYSDYCGRGLCGRAAPDIARNLYWTMSREAVGAISLLKDKVDGIILLSAYPCGTDSLVNELVMRRVSGLPVIQLLLDEHRSEAGLLTRLESFADVIRNSESGIRNSV